ncbi:iron ABC transporter permease [Thermococcus indicus]|uniref:Iron ABC transporter permease n=2 Tax=Thermococcus indicus TaxID=2586643 RepID=A0A4Y5SQH4_9EURY|nr:iron ABC transporter permease [Thermococcus indicus]
MPVSSSIFGKAFFVFLPILAIFLGIFVGSYPTNPFSLDEIGKTIIMNIRLPRTLLAVSAGIGLSLAGMTFQAVFRNPLVEGSLLGVSAGAAVGAALGFAFLPQFGITPLALLFGMVAVGFAYMIARMGGRLTPVSLILGGVIVSALFSAVLSILLILLPNEGLSGIVIWMMGSFSNAEWWMIKYSLPAVSIIGVVIYLLSFKLDVLSLGEEAELLGVNLTLWRTIFVFLASALVACIVSFTGMIGWVGLVVPHIARMIVGPEHSSLTPTVVSIGVTTTVMADVLVRLLPFDVPVGILMTLIGVPFFAYLLKKTGGGWS